MIVLLLFLINFFFIVFPKNYEHDNNIAYIFIHSTGPSNYFLDIIKNYLYRIRSSIDSSFFAQCEKKIWDENFFCRERLWWGLPKKEFADFFYPGLIKTNRYVNIIGPLAESWNFNFPFTLNGYIRMVAGKKLYEEIKKYIKNKKIYIIGHSHGTDILIHAIQYAIKIGDENFSIDSLVLWGSPINKITESVIHTKNHNNKYYIKNVYNIYSPEDLIQIIDFTHNFPCCKRTIHPREGVFNIWYKQDKTLFHLNILYLFTLNFKNSLNKISSEYESGFFIYNKSDNTIVSINKPSTIVSDFISSWGKVIIVGIVGFSTLYLLSKKKYFN